MEYICLAFFMIYFACSYDISIICATIVLNLKFKYKKYQWYNKKFLDFTFSISSVFLDTAIPADQNPSLRTAIGIEMCQCPSKYSGLSCQDPSDGYYRVRYNITGTISEPTIMIGRVEPCNCNGHALFCDKETGQCQVHDCVHYYKK